MPGWWPKEQESFILKNKFEILYGDNLRLSQKDQFREYERARMRSMYGRDAENISVGNSGGRRTVGKTKRRQKPNAKTNHKA